MQKCCTAWFLEPQMNRHRLRDRKLELSVSSQHICVLNGCARFEWVFRWGDGEGWRGREGGREGGREVGRAIGREGSREVGRKRSREGGREVGREGWG